MPIRKNKCINIDGTRDCKKYLGCASGAPAIPAKWVDQLELNELIQKMGVDLFIGFRGDDAWWEKYPGY